MNGKENGALAAASAMAGQVLGVAAAVCGNLGPAILRCRTARGLKQSELGALIGLTNAEISKYECGRHRPPLDALVAMALVLGTSLDKLTGLQEARAPLPKAREVASWEAALGELPGELGEALLRIVGATLAAHRRELAATPERETVCRRVEAILRRSSVPSDLVPHAADEIAGLLVVARAVAAASLETAAPAVAARP
jgi:transcriptional regulator with XRE-family HTH domain